MNTLSLVHLLDQNDRPCGKLHAQMQPPLSVCSNNLLLSVPCQLAKHRSLLPVWRLRFTHRLPCRDGISMLFIQRLYEKGGICRKMVQVQNKGPRASTIVYAVRVFLRMSHRERDFCF